MGKRAAGRRASAFAVCLGLATYATGCATVSEPSSVPVASSAATGGTGSSSNAEGAAQVAPPLADGTATSGAVGPQQAPSESTRITAGAAGSLPDSSTSPRSAPVEGTEVALLADVRAGAGDGYERIVFEFHGSTMPGYKIRWVEGPILADGSGRPVDVRGTTYLEVSLKSASGVDPLTGSPAYSGASRLEVAPQTVLLTDLVRSGDFEGVLTWVAGTSHEAPFRVLTLRNPTRVVVDVERP